MTSPVSPSETIAKAMEGVEIFHVSRSSDGKNEWYSARDAATGVSIPCESKDNATALVGSLNAAFAHHLARQAEAMKREMAELRALLSRAEEYIIDGVTNASGGQP